MDLEEIKTIVCANMEDQLKRNLIIRSIASDPEAINDVLKILHNERMQNKDLIRDMNLELSRTHIYIEIKGKDDKKCKDTFSKEFVMDEVRKFYEKYSNVIKHCFNRFN